MTFSRLPPTADPERYLRFLWEQLPRLRDDPFEAPVDQLEHALQCASRAWRDGASREWVLCALFHDIGRMLDAEDHAQASAQLLEPLLGPEALWVLAHHDEFMFRYAPPEANVDREMRRRYEAHPCYAKTAHFADEWDSKSFDPNYPTLPLSFFEPLLFDYALELTATLQTARHHERAN